MVIDFSYDFRSFEHKRAHADKFKQQKIKILPYMPIDLLCQFTNYKMALYYFIIFHGI